ncbi:MAG: hypothetical protein V1776_01265 [Candidatus Diapherotrites archaeon]
MNGECSYGASGTKDTDILGKYDFKKMVQAYVERKYVEKRK